MTNKEWRQQFINLYVKTKSRDKVVKCFLETYADNIVFEDDFDRMKYAINWLDWVFDDVSLVEYN